MKKTDTDDPLGFTIPLKAFMSMTKAVICLLVVIVLLLGVILFLVIK